MWQKRTKKKIFSDVINDGGMFFWITRMGLKGSHKYPSKRETHTRKRRRQCDRGGRDWSDVSTSQGMLAATGSRKRQGTDSPLELLEEA